MQAIYFLVKWRLYLSIFSHCAAGLVGAEAAYFGFVQRD
jgi:hypothetical protein